MKASKVAWLWWKGSCCCICIVCGHVRLWFQRLQALLEQRNQHTMLFHQHGSDRTLQEFSLRRILSSHPERLFLNCSPDHKQNHANVPAEISRASCMVLKALRKCFVLLFQTGKKQKKKNSHLHTFVAFKRNHVIKQCKCINMTFRLFFAIQCQAKQSFQKRKSKWRWNRRELIDENRNYLCWLEVSSNLWVKFLHWSVSFSISCLCSEIIPSSSWTVVAKDIFKQLIFPRFDQKIILPCLSSISEIIVFTSFGRWSLSMSPSAIYKIFQSTL